MPPSTYPRGRGVIHRGDVTNLPEAGGELARGNSAILAAMARLDLRHPANAAGAWYVDTRCIDCDTCRRLAPESFAEYGGQSVVKLQPSGVDDPAVWRASVACPTQSIGRLERGAAPSGLFPQPLAPGVFYCGYTSEDSYGASAYLVQRDVGNLLIDAPRWSPRLADTIRAHGGIDHVLLTHRDDVADAKRYADHFEARVWIHADDARAAPFATDFITGGDPQEILPGVVLVPVPGHSKGSVVFVVTQQESSMAFTGDSLAWSRERGDLVAFRDACWHSWSAQLASLARLNDAFVFNWVLPGHGDPIELPRPELHARLAALIARG